MLKVSYKMNNGKCKGGSGKVIVKKKELKNNFFFFLLEPAHTQSQTPNEDNETGKARGKLV